MSKDLTLPGSIPGLLRRGSPVIVTRRTHTGFAPGTTGIALRLERRAVWRIGWGVPSGSAHPAQQSCIALDLTDPTGRVHAAWWAEDVPVGPWLSALAPGEEDELIRFMREAGQRVGMSDDQITRFRDLCLKLAGVLA